MKKIAIILFCIFSLSCEQEPPTLPGEKVKLINLTGLDGCGWAFETEDNKKLEPANLHLFDIALNENTYYSITYEKQDAGSICMVGDIITVKTISKWD